MKLYRNREEKARWAAQQFKSIFEEIGSVLDVGCNEGYLEKFLPKKLNILCDKMKIDLLNYKNIKKEN